jgi:hypothetical protein
MKTQGVKASSMILAGSLLTTFTSVGRGWAASVITLIGFIIFIIGLNGFKKELDDTGQSAIGLIFIAAIIGGAGALLGLIPLIGIIGGLAALAAFIIQLIGYIKLKGSTAIGSEGAKGANLLFISMIIALVGGIIKIIPGLGGIIAPLFFLAVLLMIFYGWFGVQKGYLGEAKINVQSVTFILGGMLLQLGNSATKGWGSAVASVIGFVLFLVGLNGLKNSLDAVGKAAVKLIIVAVFIGIGASLLDLVASVVNISSGLNNLAKGDISGLGKPSVLDMIVSAAFIAAFVVEMLGFAKLKGSETIGETGKSGATLLIVAMILAAAASLTSGLLPIGGGIITGILGIVGLFLVLFGWLKIQEALAEKA